MTTPNVFYSAITARAGSEVIPGSEVLSEKQLRFMIRVAPGPTTTVWLGLVRHLLGASRGSTWTIDISKQYFLTPDGDLRYGWRIILQAASIAQHFQALADIVKKAEVRGAQLEEVKLNGSPNRRVGGYFGHVATGPAALSNR